MSRSETKARLEECKEANAVLETQIDDLEMEVEHAEAETRDLERELAAVNDVIYKRT